MGNGLTLSQRLGLWQPNNSSWKNKQFTHFEGFILTIDSVTPPQYAKTVRRQIV